MLVNRFCGCCCCVTIEVALQDLPDGLPLPPLDGRSFSRYISMSELAFGPGFPDSLSRTSWCHCKSRWEGARVLGLRGATRGGARDRAGASVGVGTEGEG